MLLLLERARTHARMHTCMHACTHACTHACSYTQTHTGARAHTHSHTGTKFRQMLRAGEDIPEWFAFKSVVKVLREA